MSHSVIGAAPRYIFSSIFVNKPLSEVLMFNREVRIAFDRIVAHFRVGFND